MVYYINRQRITWASLSKIVGGGGRGSRVQKLHVKGALLHLTSQEIFNTEIGSADVACKK